MANSMCHVLIIEDDVLAALDIGDTLTDAGATSYAIADTEELAVECAHEQRPDVITADVRLARGSGPQAVIRIEAELGPIPVIFVTATPSAATGFEHFAVIQKPFRPARLVEAFKAVAP